MSSPSATKQDFEYVLEYVENSPGVVDNAAPDLKLKLYGLYKQATCGDCKEDVPSIFNMRAKYKHDAWKSQSGLNREEAARAYVKTVQDLDPTLRLPSQQMAQPYFTHTGKRGSRLGSSSNSLSALVHSDSRDLLDRLLGPPPRLASPAHSLRSEQSATLQRVTIGASVSDENVEEKVSGAQDENTVRIRSIIQKRKMQTLSLGSQTSLDELKPSGNSDENAGSTESSIIASSAPTTPQQSSASLQSVLKMRKSSSLTWGKAEDYTPLTLKSLRRQRQKNAGLTNGQSSPDEDVDDDDDDDDDNDDDNSKSGWESDDEDAPGIRRIYSGTLMSDSDADEDDYDDYGSDYDFPGAGLLTGDRGTNTENDDSETFLCTVLYTMPFVAFLKIYQHVTSLVFLPFTTMLSFLGYKVAKEPDTTSVREKKQAATTLLFASIIPMTPVVYMWMFFFLIFPFTTLPTAAYIAWMLFWDESPRNGQRRPILRDVPLAKYFVEYFPITLTRRSAPLDTKHKYVFAYHPHGIIGLGSFGAFATHAAGFKEKFPGIDIRLLTLDSNFKVPILREILLNFGICSCSRSSCDNILGRGPGSAICLVVGGAAESLETEEGTYRLVLGRKGFVQVAVENDADLVPVIAFGETDAFDTFSAKPGTVLREIQVFIQRKLKFTVPIFWGRGVLNSNFGFMPKRRPIHVVTGEPLSIKPFRDRGLEGDALVDAVHKAYIAALRRLFDENKDDTEPGIKRKESLTIIK